MGKAVLTAVTIGLVWVVSACAGPVQSPVASLAGSTANPGATAGAWIAARVEQPAAIEALPTDAPGFCSPCHPAIGTYIDAMAQVPGGYLALGFDLPPSHAAAWLSTDTRTWRRVADLPAPDGSLILAAAPGPLAVGTSGGAAATWRTSDGLHWTIETLEPPERAGATERLTAVARDGSTYLAGGYAAAADGSTTATFWRFVVGSWQRSSVSGAAANSRITGMAETGGVAVAVGFNGDPRRGTMQTWRSTDSGITWLPVSSGAFAAGRPLAIASDRGSFCAVGETADQTAAAAWLSTDGSTWEQAAAQPALDNGNSEMPIEAIAALGAGRGYVAAGWKSDAGNGSAVVLRSVDCRSWTRLPQDPSFSGAGMAAVSAPGPVLAAGSMGWPDTHSAQVWVGSL